MLTRTEELLAVAKPCPSDWVEKATQLFAELLDNPAPLTESAELRAAVEKLVGAAYTDCPFARPSLSLGEEMRCALMEAAAAAAAPPAPPVPLEESLAAQLAAVVTLPEDAQANRLAELVEEVSKVDTAQLATNPVLFRVANTLLETAFGDPSFAHCYLSLAYELEDALAAARRRKDFVKA
jgi:hypothetical protein